MEGPSDLKRPRVQTKLETAWEALYVFRGNAFIDWMRDADEEDKRWAKRVFNCHNKPSWEWEVRGPDCVELVNGIGSVYLRLERDASPRGQPVDTFPLLRYMWERNNSICMLDACALSVIYGVLHSPTDMLNFMRVNRRFHQAAVGYLGYDVLIQRLMKRGRVLTFPMYKGIRSGAEGAGSNTQTSEVKPYQRFFAMCFLSCKSDETLSRCIINAMQTGNWDLILYVRNLIRPLKRNGILKDVDLWLRDGETRAVIYEHYIETQHGTMKEAEVILGNGTFYFPEPKTTMPLPELRTITEEIVFPKLFGQRH